MAEDGSAMDLDVGSEEWLRSRFAGKGLLEDKVSRVLGVAEGTLLFEREEAEMAWEVLVEVLLRCYTKYETGKRYDRSALKGIVGEVRKDRSWRLDERVKENFGYFVEALVLEMFGWW